MAKFVRHVGDKLIVVPDAALKAGFSLAVRDDSFVRVYADGTLVLDDVDEAGKGGCITVDSRSVLDGWRVYEITSASGVHGQFAGRDEQQALETMHRQYGHQDSDAAAAVYGMTAERLNALFSVRAL